MANRSMGLMCWVAIGFFAVLQGRQYCMSNAYVSTKMDELANILRLLKAQKVMVQGRVSGNV